MPRRMGRPGLLGTMARTAVVAGTATAVVGGVQGRQNAAAQQQAAQQQAAQQQASASPAPASAPADAQGDLLTQLERLGQLKAAGVLDDAEFATAKAKLLGI